MPKYEFKLKNNIVVKINAKNEDDAREMMENCCFSNGENITTNEY